MEIPAPVQKKIDEYLDRVAAHLANRPPQEARSILNDLESQIQEALADRAAGREPAPEDVSAVLAEMDAPESFDAPAEAPSPLKRLGLGGLALAISLAGVLILTIQVAVFGPWYRHSPGPELALLLPITLCQVIAIILGVMSWREKLGKVAVIAASAILLVGLGLTS